MDECGIMQPYRQRIECLWLYTYIIIMQKIYILVLHAIVLLITIKPLLGVPPFSTACIKRPVLVSPNGCLLIQFWLYYYWKHIIIVIVYIKIVIPYWSKLRLFSFFCSSYRAVSKIEEEDTDQDNPSNSVTT